MEGQAMKRCRVISMVALLAVSGVAHGATIVLEFVGHVHDTDRIFSGTLRVNSELQDQDPFSAGYGYYAPMRPGHVTAESGQPGVPNYLALFSGSRGQIDVINDEYFGDFYEVTVGGFFEDCRGITGPPLQGLKLCEFRLQLGDEDGLGLDSDALPLSIDLEQFEYNVIWLEWIDFRDPCCGHPPKIGRASCRERV